MKNVGVEEFEENLEIMAVRHNELIDNHYYSVIFWLVMCKFHWNETGLPLLPKDLQTHIGKLLLYSRIPFEWTLYRSTIGGPYFALGDYKYGRAACSVCLRCTGWRSGETLNACILHKIDHDDDNSVEFHLCAGRGCGTAIMIETKMKYRSNQPERRFICGFCEMTAGLTYAEVLKRKFGIESYRTPEKRTIQMYDVDDDDMREIMLSDAIANCNLFENV